MPSSFLPVIFPCKGEKLSPRERALFQEANPWGFILFARNLKNPQQIRRLTEALWESVQREAPILIDQEGGKVQRLKPPIAPLYPPAARFGELAKNNPQKARSAAKLCGRLIADDLFPLGIRVNCAPVLDLPIRGASAAIGSRAFGATPQETASLARAFAEGLLEGGVLPVIKHIPGQGRARSDTHLQTPLVSDDLKTLSQNDFAPFKELSNMPLAMTAHLVYSAIDKNNPATVSQPVIQKIIRKKIGFNGLLLSDALEMKALKGSLPQRAQKALEAGCDLALPCLPNIKIMEDIARHIPAVKETPRFKKSMRFFKKPKAFDRQNALHLWEKSFGSPLG